MRLTLVHNPGAGEGSTSRDDLLRVLRSPGHEVSLVPHEEAGRPQALHDPGDTVVVAGGDGTVADVARQVAGTDVPMAILPTGTANNIARTFGVRRGHPALMRAIGTGDTPAGTLVPWTLGRATASWGSTVFAEAAGIGLVAHFLREVRDVSDAHPHTDPTLAEARYDEIRRARRFLQRVAERMRPSRLSLRVDGDDMSGEYLMAEVMNVRFAGPAIELVPPDEHRQPGLVLVTLRPEHRSEFVGFLNTLIRGGDGTCPADVRPARRIRMSWPSNWGRIDDEEWPLALMPARGSEEWE